MIEKEVNIAKEFENRWEEIRKLAVKEWLGIFAEGKASVIVGSATCGRSAGAMQILEVCRQEKEKLLVNVEVLEGGCLGHCYAEPMAIFHTPRFPPLLYGYLTDEKVRILLKKLYLEGDPVTEWCMGAMHNNPFVPTVYENPRFRFEDRRILARCGIIDPENIMHAIYLGCYRGFLNSLKMSPQEIIEEVKESGIRGLGGAGFPTWKKMKSCAEAGDDGEKFIICNADEGDPGAFMDRVILESDPHGVIEGMLIAARACSARHGFVYVRHEYPLAVKRIRKAIEDARKIGLLGNSILGTEMHFDIEVKEGAGAFVCGESTALIASIEGKRGMPRVRPPRSVNYGFEGKPTLLQNVKTLMGLGLILRNSGKWYSSLGTEKSKGTAVFALAGKIKKTGLVEIRMGTKIRDIIEIFGGGISVKQKTSDVIQDISQLKQKNFKAVQIGGPSGGWIPENLLDTPIDFDSLQRSGAIMGSGGMVVIDEDNCIVQATRFFLEFTQKESCGKCNFCRIGTWHMLRILEKITTGKATMDDLNLLEELAIDVKKGSLCNLGKTAPNPVLSSIRHFRSEYETHITDKRCPSLECRDLISYQISLKKCVRSCEACVGSCPVEAIFTRKDGLKEIDQTKCIKCGACFDACPSHYDAVIKISPPIFQDKTNK